MRPKERRKIVEERHSDEESLYYILERDLDRDAIFPENDGWYSQIRLGKRKRIDYVVRYGDKIYGIEVKTGIPRLLHFRQVESYRDFVNGIFLAYPSDRVGEALFLLESRQEYEDVGLISLTLFRSHLIRRTRQHGRVSNKIWNSEFIGEEYWKRAKTWSWERADLLPATILKDQCFSISFNPKGKYSENDLYRLALSGSAWIGLGLLYAISSAVSFDRYYSNGYMWKLSRELGFGEFDLWPWVQCDIVDVMTYGDLMWTYSFNSRGLYLLEHIQKALKGKLGANKWRTLLTKMGVWKKRHREKQRRYRKEFILQ